MHCTVIQGGSDAYQPLGPSSLIITFRWDRENIFENGFLCLSPGKMIGEGSSIHFQRYSLEIRAFRCRLED